MATLGSLEKSGDLVRIEDPEPGTQPWRCLYGTREFIKWLDEELNSFKTTVVGGEIEPIEQVDAVFSEFIAGENFDSERRFKKLSRRPDLFVWEFKTQDIRIFGWFPVKDHFICTYGDMKDEIELKNKYGRYMAQTEYFRQNLDLDEPKYIESGNYKDVLSDAHK
jgi:hypothetical protein